MLSRSDRPSRVEPAQQAETRRPGMVRHMVRPGLTFPQGSQAPSTSAFWISASRRALRQPTHRGSCAATGHPPVRSNRRPAHQRTALPPDLEPVGGFHSPCEGSQLIFRLMISAVTIAIGRWSSSQSCTPRCVAAGKPLQARSIPSGGTAHTGFKCDLSRRPVDVHNSVDSTMPPGCERLGPRRSPAASSKLPRRDA